MVTARQARVTGLAMLAIVFVVGALAGAATIQVLEADEAPALHRSAPDRPDLLVQLQLTVEQRAQVDALLERRRAQMEDFWNEHRPALRAIADSARTELRALLTPEQQTVEERFMAERRAHEEKKRQRKEVKW